MWVEENTAFAKAYTYFVITLTSQIEITLFVLRQIDDNQLIAKNE